MMVPERVKASNGQLLSIVQPIRARRKIAFQDDRYGMSKGSPGPADQLVWKRSSKDAPSASIRSAQMS